MSSAQMRDVQLKTRQHCSREDEEHLTNVPYFWTKIRDRFQEAKETGARTMAYNGC